MRRPFVAGNWKMNGSMASISRLLVEMRETLGEIQTVSTEILVFPAYVYLASVAEQLSGSGIELGAQNVDSRADGAVTGGVSAGMLADVGCSHVLVGHSERRTLFAESDETVAEKFERSLGFGLTPIVCVGETLEERQSGATLDVVSRQLTAALEKSGPAIFRKAMIAYEPVWAIGTGESASPEQAEEVHATLRHCISKQDAEVGEVVRILYGGSVTPENARALFAMDNIDGALVGGASLDAKRFAAICDAAEKSLDS